MLYQAMENLEVRARTLYMGLELNLETKDLHCVICNLLADEFNLWKDNEFPLWLSRVVSGVITDIEEAQLERDREWENCDD